MKTGFRVVLYDGYVQAQLFLMIIQRAIFDFSSLCLYLWLMVSWNVVIFGLIAYPYYET
jgi:hypothetical protein